ncbi:hypothetical protein SeMB42_g05367 [Synchytrium endobioticum]|uniref:Uncharacterized protein n=1 Tax=Synchytrium endobioticum TaxID=286115 RepID=A0A507D6I7_9FUNG|nr:hypothetical protein SeMB42_g05367 [Synchytrium endobioticum]TPX46917.1 hypothetical protein SeLEV6574_g02945 [Synchytrium endobioticum]
MLTTSSHHQTVNQVSYHPSPHHAAISTHNCYIDRLLGVPPKHDTLLLISEGRQNALPDDIIASCPSRLLGLFGLQCDSLQSQLRTVKAPKNLSQELKFHHQLKKRFDPDAPTPSNDALQQPRRETAPRTRVTRVVAARFTSLDDYLAMLSNVPLYYGALLLACVGIYCAFGGISNFMFLKPSTSSLREHLRLFISMLMLFGSFIMAKLAYQRLEQVQTIMRGPHTFTMGPRPDRGGQNSGEGYRLEDGPLANLDRRRSVAPAPRGSGGNSPASSNRDLRRRY